MSRVLRHCHVVPRPRDVYNLPSIGLRSTDPVDSEGAISNTADRCTGKDNAVSERALPLDRFCLSRAISEPAFGETPESVFYVLLADGRRRIVRQSMSTGLDQVVATEPEPAGRVGYGGALFAVRGDMLAYAAKDGRLHGIDLTTGEQWAITPAGEGVAAPAISPCGRFIAYLCEQDGKCNVLLVDVRGRSLPVKLSTDPWYAFNPTFSPDGGRIAWMEWDESNMPWVESRLHVARFAKATHEVAHGSELLPISVTIISKTRVSYASPQFSPDGKSLAFTSDETGWRSLWIADADGRSPARMETGEGEIGGPDWAPGLIKMRWGVDGKILYAVRRHQSRDVLLRVDRSAGEAAEIETRWTWITGLNSCRDHLVFVASDPTTPGTLVTLDLSTGQETRRATNGVGLIAPAWLSQPQVISWDTVGGTRTWGVLHPAVGPEAEKLPRPLLVSVHGGPTAEQPLQWDAQAQYFATRGWHVLSVNYRGGSGFGRAYQDLLDGRWGVVDVEDARTGAEHLIRSGQADRERLVIMGGSAGGYTTLMALTQHPDFWAAGVSLYGIGNLYEVRQGSHRFEVNYEQLLVGRLPEAGRLWKERSALTHVKNLRAPVLLLHGAEDKAVPHQQSVEFAEAVRSNGGVAELVSYEGEGHGFTKEATRRDVIVRMEKFLDKYVLCRQG